MPTPVFSGFDYQGGILQPPIPLNLSGDPDLPSAKERQIFLTHGSGRLGGALGMPVAPGWLLRAIADTDGGDWATAGSSFEIFPATPLPLDCSLNPDCPIAVAGEEIWVTGAGKFGGAAGEDVAVGDRVLCLTANLAEADWATAGSNFKIARIAGGLRSYSTTITGDGTTATFLVAHNLNADPPKGVFVWSATQLVLVEVQRVDVNSINLVFGAPLGNGVILDVCAIA